jgi:hypothetical protein
MRVPFVVMAIRLGRPVCSSFVAPVGAAGMLERPALPHGNGQCAVNGQRDGYHQKQEEAIKCFH